MCVNNLRTDFEKIALNVYNEKENKRVGQFSLIPLSNIAKDNNGNAIPCPDQFVGVLKVETDKVSWVESRPAGSDGCYNIFNDKISKKYINNTIAIVIESPHVYEFSKENALGPAIGDTGCKLLGYLPRLIYQYKLKNPNNIQNDCYKVYLINSIQYQCSLGAKTKHYRNSIFSKMWIKKEIQENFKARLTKFEPKIIINCCTKRFQKRVLKSINEVKNNSLILKAYHPSDWSFSTVIKN